MKGLRYSYLLLMLTACAKQRSQVPTSLPVQPYTYEQLSELYYKADTVIRRNDTVFIVNTRRDSIIVETGIFTYLQYDYPMSTDYPLISLTKQAISAEKRGALPEEKHCYEAVVAYFQKVICKRKNGFENGGFSDMNDMLAHAVNERLLVSHAYQKLGKLPQALGVLAPYLANVEAEKSKIQQRYVELCIRQYGKQATQAALDKSGATVRHHTNEEAPEEDSWCVTVLGAPLGIADFNTDTLTPQTAQQLVWQKPYYTLVK